MNQRGKSIKRTKQVHGNYLVFPTRMYVFALPALLMLTMFWVAPILLLLLFSFTDMRGMGSEPNLILFDNYIAILKEGLFFQYMRNTLIYTVIVVIGSNILGFLAALLTNSRIKGKAFFQSSCYLPAMISSIVVSYIWSYIYMQQDGVISKVLDVLGMNGDGHNILGNSGLALLALAVIDIWKCFGTCMLIYTASMKNLSPEIIESAKLEGCKKYQIVTKIIIPLIYPAITINVINTVIIGLKTFDYSYIITNGGPGTATTTLMLSVYKTAYSDMMIGKASALAGLAFLMMAVLTLVLLRVLRSKEAGYNE